MPTLTLEVTSVFSTTASGATATADTLCPFTLPSRVRPLALPRSAAKSTVLALKLPPATFTSAPIFMMPLPRIRLTPRMETAVLPALSFAVVSLVAPKWKELAVKVPFVPVIWAVAFPDTLFPSFTSPSSMVAWFTATLMPPTPTPWV